MYLQCLSLGRLTVRPPPASQHSLLCPNLSPSLQKEESQHTSRWKAITLLRGPMTQGKYPNSSSGSHLWQLLLRVKGIVDCSPGQSDYCICSGHLNKPQSRRITLTAERHKAVSHHLLFRPWLYPKLKTNTNHHFILPGEGKGRPKIISPLHRIANFRTTDRTHTHINFIFHPRDQILRVASHSWALLCTPFLLLGKGQSSHTQQIRPNSLLRRAGAYSQGKSLLTFRDDAQLKNLLQLLRT